MILPFTSGCCRDMSVVVHTAGLKKKSKAVNTGVETEGRQKTRPAFIHIYLLGGGSRLSSKL